MKCLRKRIFVRCFYLFIISSIYSIFFSISLIAEEEEQVTPILHAWDLIVTDDLFVDIADFQHIVESRVGERAYRFYTNDETNRIALSVVVVIAPAGKLLALEDWLAGVENADPSIIARDYPEIGARARAETLYLSPDGALSGVTFTTSDESFDVAVTLFEGSGSTEYSMFSAKDVAKKISDTYDDTRK